MDRRGALGTERRAPGQTEVIMVEFSGMSPAILLIKEPILWYCRSMDRFKETRGMSRDAIDSFNDAIGLLGLMLLGAVLIYVVFFW